MKRFVRGLMLVIAATPACLPALADSVLLTNGRRVKGIIVSQEGDPNVVLEVGSGTMILERDEVAVIRRSTPEEQEAMRSQWFKRRLDTEAAYQQGLAEERIRSVEEAPLEPLKPKEASLTKIGGHLYANASVNDHPAQRFLLDTGAPAVILSRATAESLGIDTRKGHRTTSSIAGQKIPCVHVVLDKMEVEGFWARNVDALVYEVDGEDWVYKQDILGMSFLENFHFEINVKKGTLTLSWGEGA